jgi:hypothetical protein
MVLLRYALYIVGIAVFTGLLVWIEISTPGALKLHQMASPTGLYGTSEYSPVENIQLALLGICTLLYGWVAKTYASQRPIAFAFGGLVVACGIRELHFFFDKNVADNFWQVLVAIVLALLIVYVYRHLRRFQIAWLRLWPSPGLTLLFAGATTLFVFAQIIGHEQLWMALLGDDYRRIVKLAVEEFVELMGYYLLLIGTLEYVYQVRTITSRQVQPAATRRRESRKPKSAGRF